VFLVLAGVPAISLACEWSCAREQVWTAMHYHGHHPTATSQKAASDVGDVVLTLARELCSHVSTDIASSIAVSHVNMLLAAMALRQVPLVAQTAAVGVTALSTDKSPPGVSRRRSVLRV
jgi:hypothetical protein